MKLHIGCGSVYLRNYINVDVPGSNTFLATDRPDLVEKWITDAGDYYGRHQDKTIETLREGPVIKETVCDRYGSFAFIPAPDNSCAEILARHVFEHMSLSEAHAALEVVRRVLILGGIIRIDVPHHTETVRLLMETQDPFYARHLIGPRNGDYGYHMMSYDRTRLKALFDHHGYSYLGEEPNIHIYPAFCLRFGRP